MRGNLEQSQIPSPRDQRGEHVRVGHPTSGRPGVRARGDCVEHLTVTNVESRSGGEGAASSVRPPPKGVVVRDVCEGPRGKAEKSSLRDGR